MNPFGLVLAGGHSKRMEKDKSALNYFGKSQVEHTYDLLKIHCGRVFVSCRKDQDQEPHMKHLPQIHDKHTGIGPLGGILSAMSKYPGTPWVVMACDLPFFNEKALQILMEGRNPQKMATAFWNEDRSWPEPLCSIYEPTIHAPILKWLAQGKSCPRHLLMSVETQMVSPQDPLTLRNVNTQDDWKEAGHLLEGLYQGCPV